MNKDFFSFDSCAPRAKIDNTFVVCMKASDPFYSCQENVLTLTRKSQLSVYANFDLASKGVVSTSSSYMNISAILMPHSLEDSTVILTLKVSSRE